MPESSISSSTYLTAAVLISVAAGSAAPQAERMSSSIIIEVKILNIRFLLIKLNTLEYLSDTVDNYDTKVAISCS